MPAASQQLKVSGQWLIGFDTSSNGKDSYGNLGRNPRPSRLFLDNSQPPTTHSR